MGCISLPPVKMANSIGGGGDVPGKNGIFDQKDLTNN